MSLIRKVGVIAFTFLCANQLSVAMAETSTSYQSLEDAVRSGATHIDLRYRLEHVDDDNFGKNALASTLRLRLNYASGKWRNWSVFTEFDYVGEVLSDNYNSGGGTSSSARAVYPVVADPNGADLNQLYVDYHGFQNVQLRLGRQRILIDDQRFVGGVGWRQNEQTYDGVTFGYTGLSNSTINYRYVNQINRIFGEGSAAGRNEVDAHLINGEFRLAQEWRILPYIYLIDNDDVPGFSTNTFGVKATKNLKVGAHALNFSAAIAEQTDGGNNPVDYDAQYLHFGANWTLPNTLALGFGAEILEGDNMNAGSAFRTPLATLHKFQGWADKFLATPGAGIEDIYLSAKYPVRGWKLAAIYHDFSAQDGSGDFGSELDLSAAKTFYERYNLLLKAAFFDSSSAGYSDTSKVWIMLHTKY